MTDYASSSDILRREIEAQSEEEAAGILDQARQDAERILKQAAGDAASDREKVLAGARMQADTERKRVLSGVQLEIKKQRLRSREEMIERIFAEVRNKLQEFRTRPGYADFLHTCILEGGMAVDQDDLKLICGTMERKILKPAFLRTVRDALAKLGRSCRLELDDATEEEGGVLVVSADGRMRFDNRFSARIRRKEQALRLAIIKALEDQQES